VSEVTKQRFLGWAKLDGDKAFLLPPAIDLGAFRPGPKDTALLGRYGLTGKTVLMTVGRLASDERYKGVDQVLELLPALSKDIPNIAYLVVGDGTDLLRLEEKAKSLRVDDRVVFAGLIPEAEKANHYRLADAYVMPGWGEGFGIVYLEAMACGIPVVASKVDGSREAVRQGTLGILVDPNDQEEIRTGIIEALNRPRGVVPEGLEYFSYDRFEQRLHHIVSDVVRKGAIADQTDLAESLKDS
jgi:glycosyltransferase involved in cell wall biosynthesis